MHWSRILWAAAVAVGFLALCSCSNSRRLTPDELRSDVFSASSYASEVEMFIDYVRQGHATRRFAESHALQLAQEIQHSEEELASAIPERQDASALQSCKAELDFLRRELPVVPTLMGNDAELAAERAKVEAYHHQFCVAASSL